MILAVAMLAKGLPAGALEVEAGGVHEHQVEPREQIAPVLEQPLLDQVRHGFDLERVVFLTVLHR